MCHQTACGNLLYLDGSTSAKLWLANLFVGRGIRSKVKVLTHLFVGRGIRSKVKVEVLCSIQNPGSYWGRYSILLQILEKGKLLFQLAI